MPEQATYTEADVRSLDWKEHIRFRPGMYIGKLGDGSSQDDGIYILLKETLDNCIDEYVMGYGKNIDISINDQTIKVRDYGRGIPLGKLIDCVSRINTGAKYDTRAFKKSVGLNGVGTKAVNALSSYFRVESVRDGKIKVAEFERGVLGKEKQVKDSSSRKGTNIIFIPDEEIFGNFHFLNEYVEKMLWNYVYLNTGLTMSFYKKDYEAIDIRSSIVAAISVKVIEPIFESQTKTKLGSQEIEPGGKSMRAFVNDFIKTKLDNYLHKNPAIAEAIQNKILQSEKERKEMSGIRKLARERAKKAGLHNKKLRDCRVHYNTNHDRRLESTLFITEGESASGSITKSRDPNTQAVFSLKGKPLNVYGLTKKIVYENEEFNLLQAALNIEDGLEGLRYNNIVFATDADVDGMHIRLLLVTFFLQFFPDLVKNGHLYILQTPLFRVRNKKETIYCYSEKEKRTAIKLLGVNPEITRFKGLGEISPGEFKHFIGDGMRLEPVIIGKKMSISKTLDFYMGKNTPERQEFIINNLVVEKDLVMKEI